MKITPLIFLVLLIVAVTLLLTGADRPHGLKFVQNAAAVQEVTAQEITVQDVSMSDATVPKSSVSKSSVPQTTTSHVITTANSPRPVFDSVFLSSADGPASVHAGTVTYLSNGDLMTAWFGGSREGAKDVSIYSATRSADGTWSQQKVIASRQQTTKDLNRYIRKLGNPVLFTDGQGRTWLFYVTVCMGGWSGGSVTCRFSDDCGQTWSQARQFNCAPFLNAGTLIKGKPLLTTTGHILLPVYHEFFNKFAELLVLDPDGNLVDKYRLNADGGSLQPWVIPDNSHQAYVFCRQYKHAQQMTLVNGFDLASRQWQPVKHTNVRNPGAGIAVIRRWNGQMMMVFNSGIGRERLSIAVSDDGMDWKEMRDIEVGIKGDEFSYPYLIQGTQVGTYHLIYTWQRQKMKMLTFNEAWLEQTP